MHQQQSLNSLSQSTQVQLSRKVEISEPVHLRQLQLVQVNNSHVNNSKSTGFSPWSQIHSDSALSSAVRTSTFKRTAQSRREVIVNRFEEHEHPKSSSRLSSTNEASGRNWISID